MNVSTRWTRSRLRTVGAPFSSETVTSALQPECTRKPTAACFMEASAAEGKGDPIYIVAPEKGRPLLRVVPLTPAAGLPPLLEQFHVHVRRRAARHKASRGFRAGPRGSSSHS